jgi:hypothetical protein
MPSINSATTRGRVSSSYTNTGGLATDQFLDTRDQTIGGTSASVNTNDTVAISARTTGIANRTSVCSRYFMAFDTSSITSTPGFAELYLYGETNITGNLIVVKSTAPSLVNNINSLNFASITGFAAASSMAGLVTDYTSPFTLTTGSGWNSVPLNSTALSDIDSLTTFRIAIVNYDYDYLYVDPNANFNQSCGINITNQPYLLITSFSGQIYSIPLIDISKVNDVSVSNINNINT